MELWSLEELLGNPWIFQDIRDGAESNRHLSLEDWYRGVQDHIKWQIEEYGETPRAILPLRKHLLWYSKGWPCSTYIREQINNTESIETIQKLLDGFVEQLVQKNFVKKDLYDTNTEKNHFNWNPSCDTRELLQYAAPLVP